MNRSHSPAVLRTLLGSVLPLVLVAAAALPFVLFHERLPEPLATHWGLNGRPDGAMPLAGMLAIVLAPVGAAAIGMARIARRNAASAGEISAPMAVVALLAGLTVMLSWTTVVANLDAASWRQADRLHIVTFFVPLLLAGTLAYSAARLSRGLETASPLAPDAPRTGLAPGARAVWVGSVHSGWAAPLAIGGLLVGALLTSWKPLGGLPFLAVGLAGLAFTSLRMTVDRNGVRLAYGAFGWPVQRIALADIRQATVLRVDPMAWGGWGYRGSLKIMRRAAVVLRGGDGVRLDLTGDRTLVITIDNATQAAGLINGLLATDNAGQNRPLAPPPPNSPP